MKKLIVIMSIMLLLSACGTPQQPITDSNTEITFPEASEVIAHSDEYNVESWVIESEGCKFVVVQSSRSWSNIAIAPIGACNK